MSSHLFIFTVIYFFSRLIQYSPPQCYGFRKAVVDLSCCMIKLIKKIFLEEVRLAIVCGEHSIEAVWNAFPERGYRLWVAWVH